MLKEDANFEVGLTLNEVHPKLSFQEHIPSDSDLETVVQVSPSPPKYVAWLYPTTSRTRSLRRLTDLGVVHMTIPSFECDFYSSLNLMGFGLIDGECQYFGVERRFAEVASGLSHLPAKFRSLREE